MNPQEIEARLRQYADKEAQEEARRIEMLRSAHVKYAYDTELLQAYKLLDILIPLGIDVQAEEMVHPTGEVAIKQEGKPYTHGLLLDDVIVSLPERRDDALIVTPVTPDIGNNAKLITEAYWRGVTLELGRMKHNPSKIGAALFRTIDDVRRRIAPYKDKLAQPTAGESQMPPYHSQDSHTAQQQG